MQIASQPLAKEKSGFADQVTAPSPYERAFAHFLGSSVQAFAFWKGRVALYAILKALEIGPGDEVIVPAYTCVVVPNAIRLAGAKPVYVDITPGSYHLDPDLFVQSITGRAKAVLVQHTYGIPSGTAQILSLARQKGLYVIEDCAHALGSYQDGKHVGLQGDAAFFSSQWSKPYTTGLGGIAVTLDPSIAGKLSQLQAQFRQPPVSARVPLMIQYLLYRQFFTPRMYWRAQAILHALGHWGLFVGSSTDSELSGQLPTDHEWLMPAFQQKAGSRQLVRASAGVEKRHQLSDLYDLELKRSGWQVDKRFGATTLLRYPVRVGNKETLLEVAQHQQVEIGSWFETPLHPIPLDLHEKFGYRLGQCPHSETAAQQVVNLPLHDRVTFSEAARIIHFFLANAHPPR